MMECSEDIFSCRDHSKSRWPVSTFYIESLFYNKKGRKEKEKKNGQKKEER